MAMTEVERVQELEDETQDLRQRLRRMAAEKAILEERLERQTTALSLRQKQVRDLDAGLKGLAANAQALFRKCRPPEVRP